MEADGASNFQAFQVLTFPPFVQLLALEDVHSMALFDHQVVIRHDCCRRKQWGPVKLNMAAATVSMKEEINLHSISALKF